MFEYNSKTGYVLCGRMTAKRNMRFIATLLFLRVCLQILSSIHVLAAVCVSYVKTAQQPYMRIIIYTCCIFDVIRNDTPASSVQIGWRFFLNGFS